MKTDDQGWSEYRLVLTPEQQEILRELTGKSGEELIITRKDLERITQRTSCK